MVRRSLKRRNMRGGADAAEAKQPLEKFKEHCKDISDLITDATEIYLWVIDMQHDFIDDDFKDKTVLTTEEIPATNLIEPNMDIPIETLNQTIKIRIGDGIKKVEQRLNDDWDKLNNENKERYIHKGRFAIDEGLQCIKDIEHYINLLTDSTIKSKLKQIIFSRDLHTSSSQISNDKIDKPNHCSFSVSGSNKGKIDGIGFPAHCVNGTVGCKLHPDIWTMVTKHSNKSMVVIKGCQHDVDSFGAVPYSCKDDSKLYTKSRQHNGCNTECSHDDIELPETGSYVLDLKMGASSSGAEE